MEKLLCKVCHLLAPPTDLRDKVRHDYVFQSPFYPVLEGPGP